MSNTLTVTIDRSLCIGAAACVAEAPAYFELDEDNLANLKVALPVIASDEQKKALVDAAQSCPTGAIAVTAA